MERYVKNSTAVGLLLVIISIGLFYCGATRDTVTQQTVLAGLASMTGAVGLVSIIQDALLKRSLLRDLLDMVGLAERITKAALTDVRVNASAYDWETLYARGSTYEVLPLDPRGASAHEWQLLLDAAQRRAIRVRVFLPVHFPSRAPAEETEVAPVTELAVGWADTWRRRGDSIHEKSSLEVWSFAGPTPTVGYAISERDLVLTVPPALGIAEDPQVVVAVFECGADSPVESWVRRSLQNLPSCQQVEAVPPRRRKEKLVEMPSVSQDADRQAVVLNKSDVESDRRVTKRDA